MNDVVVIGAGIVGAGAAYRLAREGVRVTLVDRLDAGQATAAGAGIISPGSSIRRLPILDPLFREAIAYYETLLPQLAEDGAPATGFQTVGSLVVAASPEEAKRLQDVAQHAAEQQAAGMPAIGTISRLTGSEARELFPPLAEVPAALYLSDAARVSGRLMCAALRRAAARQGAKVIRGSAQFTTAENGHVGVKVDGLALPGDAVIVAAGAWSAALTAAIGLALPLYPQRGQIMHLDLPNDITESWPVVTGFHSHYLLAFPRRRVVAGATREGEAGYDARVTIAGVNEVTGEALRIAPGLAAASWHEMRVGLRPATPDGLPIMGRLPGTANAYIVTGHGPSGLQLGPYSGALVADLVLGKPAPLDLGPFAPERFQLSSLSPL